MGRTTVSVNYFKNSRTGQVEIPPELVASVAKKAEVAIPKAEVGMPETKPTIVKGVQIQGNKVIRDDGLELGILNQSAQMPISKTGAYQGSGSWYAKPIDGRGKYFVNPDNAIKWLVRQSRSKLPISRLGEAIFGKTEKGVTLEAKRPAV